MQLWSHVAVHVTAARADRWPEGAHAALSHAAAGLPDAQPSGQLGGDFRVTPHLPSGARVPETLTLKPVPARALLEAEAGDSPGADPQADGQLAVLRPHQGPLLGSKRSRGSRAQQHRSRAGRELEGPVPKGHTRHESPCVSLLK